MFAGHMSRLSAKAFSFYYYFAAWIEKTERQKARDGGKREIMRCLSGRRDHGSYYFLFLLMMILFRRTSYFLSADCTNDLAILCLSIQGTFTPSISLSLSLSRSLPLSPSLNHSLSLPLSLSLSLSLFPLPISLHDCSADCNLTCPG
eukprot:sb/3473783/